MICKECGNRLPDDSIYCNHCGTKIRGNDEAEFLAMNRRKNRYIVEKQNERSYKPFASKAADAAWSLATLLYIENMRKSGIGDVLSKKCCPPDARFIIEMDAECIMKTLDAIHYKSVIERSKKTA